MTGTPQTPPQQQASSQYPQAPQGQGLARLFLLNALFTLAGGIILLVAPNQLSQLVGVHIDPNTYFVYYLLSVASLSLAVPSFFGIVLTDVNALRALSWTFLVFHASSAGVAVYAFARDLSAAVWANILVHVLFSILFVYYGLMRTSESAL
ncbi:MAG: hypothetical protein ACXVIF_03645 [Halobacteriota archaeon]